MGIKINVFREPQNKFPSLFIIDGYFMSQLLINIISYAVKLTKEGEVKITLKWISDDF